MTGWGQVLPLFVPGAEVVDAARAGASSRSFVERGRLAWIVQNLTPGDLLLISFGLIDMKPGDGRFTEPFGDYQRFLRRCVHRARERGAHPVLVTSHERRAFDPQGNLRRPLGMYPKAMRELAMALCVPLIDLNEWSAARWRAAGASGTRDLFLHLTPGEHANYPDGIEDNTHLCVRGAVECARFVAGRLRAQSLLPPALFHDLDAQIPDETVEFLDDEVFAQQTAARRVSVTPSAEEAE
nr:rhamnogalacturonan acetylesterase [Streptomyces mangrovisoli]